MLLEILLLAAACRGDGAPPAADPPPRTGASPVVAAALVRNGVAVVEHDADAFNRAPRLTLAPAPLVTLGSDEAEATFDLTFAEEVALLAGGRVATLARVGNRLLVFGADGRGQRRLGRDGGGPGEFSRIDGMARLEGGTLLVLDGGHARLSWWLPDGGVVAEQPFPVVQTFDPFTTIAGALPGGRLVMHSAGLLRPGVPDRVTRPVAPVLVVDGRTGAAREVARIPGSEVVKVETRSGGRPRPITQPLRFGSAAHVTVWDSLIVTAVGEGYAVDLRRPDGSVALRIRVPRPRRVVTRAMREARIAAEMEQFDVQNRERAVDPEPRRRLIREAPFADSFPAYGALFVTPDRRTLWVVDAQASTDTEWTATAFRPDGAITGRLSAAGPGRPIAFGDDRVVVRTEDGDGVVSLRVHHIVAAGR